MSRSRAVRNTPPATPPLLEREAELGLIAALLEAARGGEGHALLIEGAPGIGKTRLLQAAGEGAQASGMRVLSAQGNLLERDFAFGVVRSLFEPPLRAETQERAALLAGRARLVAAVLGLEEADPRTDGALIRQGESLHGLYWLTANLADLGPLLITVDDAHWADEPSLRFLAYLLRRMEELPILLMVAVRPAEPQADPALLEAIGSDPLCRSLRLGPLSVRATRQMVRGVLTEVAEDAFCAACHNATAGNPLLLGALISALSADGVAPRADQVSAVRERASGIVAAFVSPRLRRLTPEASAVAKAVAILGPGAQLRHAARLAGLDGETAAEVADALVSAHLLVRGPPGRPLEFVHPLIRQAVYDSALSAERHRSHVQAAHLLAADGASAESIAAHLLVAERLGDPWVVAALREAARSASAKGAPTVAVTYLRRALEEPPDPAARPEVLFELGSAQFRASEVEAYAALEQSLDLSTDPRARGRIALELARALEVVRDHRKRLAVLERAVDEVGDIDPDLRLHLEAQLVSVARLYPATRSEAMRRLGRLRAHAQPHSPAGCLLLANLAFETLQIEGSADKAAQLAERAVSGAGSFTGDDRGMAVLHLVSSVLVCTDRLDAASRACDAAIAQAQRQGSLLELGDACAVRAEIAYWRGAIPDAEADARLADNLAKEFEFGFGRRYTIAFLINALVERGELAAAEQLLEGSGVDMALAFLLDARGRLRCEQGRVQEGLADFLACGQRLDTRGIRHPGLIPWRAHAALAFRRLGDQQEARRLIAEDVAAARRYGARRALGIALRTSGLVARGARAIELLREAVAELEASPARLEHARALTDLGVAQLRGGRHSEAQRLLREGLDRAYSCGATALVSRASAGLRAAGVRPRRPVQTGPDALTPSEHRVARMAADGLSNADIAQALCVITKTVEAHLGRAYRKLGITSRKDLPHALGLNRGDAYPYTG
jgi:DNA-binding CsgD family transcriptional regulator